MVVRKKDGCRWMRGMQAEEQHPRRPRRQRMKRTSVTGGGGGGRRDTERANVQDLHYSMEDFGLQPEKEEESQMGF